MNERNTRSSSGMDSAALSLERTGRWRAAIADFAGTRNLAAVAVGALLALSPTIAGAQDSDPADAEFMELLEYMGSWDGAEEDWILFLGAATDPDTPTDIDPEQLTSEAEVNGGKSTSTFPTERP